MENEKKGPKWERSYGAVVFDKEGKILIEKMALGHYSIPKGHVEKDETPGQTAKREILEETGLTVDLDTRFHQDEIYSPHPGIMKKVTFFLAYPNGGLLVPQKEEVEDLLWMEGSQALESLSFKGDREVVAKAVDFRNKHLL
jgi:bis(5'-nucleosidyl)-tetraphosphatase